MHHEVPQRSYQDSFPSADLRPVEIAGGETWEEDSTTVSSLDLGSESTPDLQYRTTLLCAPEPSEGREAKSICKFVLVLPCQGHLYLFHQAYHKGFFLIFRLKRQGAFVSLPTHQ
jgi:hypothetical protein